MAHCACFWTAVFGAPIGADVQNRVFYLPLAASGSKALTKAHSNGNSNRDKKQPHTELTVVGFEVSNANSVRYMLCMQSLVFSRSPRHYRMVSEHQVPNYWSGTQWDPVARRVLLIGKNDRIYLLSHLMLERCHVAEVVTLQARTQQAWVSWSALWILSPAVTVHFTVQTIFLLLELVCVMCDVVCVGLCGVTWVDAAVMHKSFCGAVVSYSWTTYPQVLASLFWRAQAVAVGCCIQSCAKLFHLGS